MVSHYLHIVHVIVNTQNLIKNWILRVTLEWHLIFTCYTVYLRSLWWHTVPKKGCLCWACMNVCVCSQLHTVCIRMVTLRKQNYIFITILVIISLTYENHIAHLLSVMYHCLSILSNISAQSYSSKDGDEVA